MNRSFNTITPNTSPRVNYDLTNQYINSKLTPDECNNHSHKAATRAIGSGSGYFSESFSLSNSASTMCSFDASYGSITSDMNNTSFTRNANNETMQHRTLRDDWFQLEEPSNVEPSTRRRNNSITQQDNLTSKIGFRP